MSKILDVNIDAIRIANSLAGGAAITALTNSVAGQNSGTQATSANRTVIVLGEQNGKAAAQFDGVNDCYDFGNILSGKAEGTIYFLAKWALDPPTNPTKTGIWQNAADAASVVPYSNGIAYEGWGTTSRRTLGNLETDFSTAYRLYTVVSKTNDYRVYLDKDQVYSSITNTVAFPTPFIIGKSAGDVDYYFNGKVLRILAFDTAHTAAEVAAQRIGLANTYQLPNLDPTIGIRYNLAGPTNGVWIGKPTLSGTNAVTPSTETPSNYSSFPDAPPVAVLQTALVNSTAAPFPLIESGFVPNARVRMVHWLYTDKLTASIAFTITDSVGNTTTVNYAATTGAAGVADSPAERHEFVFQASASGVLTLNFDSTLSTIAGASAIELFGERSSAVPITKTIIMEGDSRVDDESVINPPPLLAALLGANYVDILDSSRNVVVPNSPIKVVNIAASGATLQGIRASQLSQPDAYAEGNVIYILDAGGNDLAAGRTAAQAFADLQFIAAAQAAKGYTVYTGTVCNAGTVTDAIRAVVTEYNNLIRAYYAANRIIDYALVPELNAYANTTYFQGDQLHYTDVGKQVKAQLAFDILTYLPPIGGVEFDEIELNRRYSEDASGGPEFSTSILSNPYGAQQRNINRYDAIHVFELSFKGEREDTAFAELLDFFMTRRGAAIGFRFFPFFDNSWEGEQIAATSPTTAVYKLIRTYTKGGRAYIRRIVKPVQPIILTINDSPASGYSPFSVDYTTGTITFSNPAGLPQNGILRVTGTYCIPVTFDVDAIQVSGFASFLDMEGLRVRELLPAALGITEE